METAVEKKIGFKKTKIGWIPEEWEVKSISETTNYVDYRGKTPEKKEKGITLLTSRNIKLGFIDYNTSKEYISSDQYSSIMSRGLPELGDVLFTTEAPMGNVAQINRLDIALAQRVIKFRAKSNFLTNDYLKYYLLSESFRIKLDEKATGGTAKGIKGSTLHKMLLVLPPLPEQKKIAEILSTWDKAIEKTTALIAQLKTRKKGLMQQLLTGKTRLAGFSGEWEKMPIGKIAKQYSTKNKEDKDIIVLSCTKHNGLVPSLEYFGRKVYGDDTSKYKVVPRGYFAYATNHIEEGSIGLQDKLENGLVSPMYTVFKTTEKINDSFFFRLLKTDRMIYMYQSNMSGSIARRGGLRWDTFETIDVKIPTLEEQKAISNFFDKIDSEIQVAENYLAKLQLQKKGLMQQLLTGQKRVSVNS